MLFGGITRNELTYDGAVLGFLPAAAFGMALMRIRQTLVHCIQGQLESNP